MKRMNVYILYFFGFSFVDFPISLYCTKIWLLESKVPGVKYCTSTTTTTSFDGLNLVCRKDSIESDYFGGWNTKLINMISLSVIHHSTHFLNWKLLTSLKAVFCHDSHMHDRYMMAFWHVVNCIALHLHAWTSMNLTNFLSTHSFPLTLDCHCLPCSQVTTLPLKR